VGDRDGELGVVDSASRSRVELKSGSTLDMGSTDTKDPSVEKGPTAEVEVIAAEKVELPHIGGDGNSV